MRKVEIEWVDSSSGATIWEDKDDYETDLPIIKTIGYLLGKNNLVVIVCQSFHDDEVGRVFRIPAGCVRKIRNI